MSPVSIPDEKTGPKRKWWKYALMVGVFVAACWFYWYNQTHTLRETFYTAGIGTFAFSLISAFMWMLVLVATMKFPRTMREWPKLLVYGVFFVFFAMGALNHNIVGAIAMLYWTFAIAVAHAFSETRYHGTTKKIGKLNAYTAVGIFAIGIAIGIGQVVGSILHY